MKQDEFLKEVTNWNNFIPALWLGLKHTKGLVIEYGAGGSTERLRKYCKDAKREFESYDSSSAWAERTGSVWVPDWNQHSVKKCGLAFVDCAPGEYRHILIKRLLPCADIICVHDSEIGGAGNYQLEKVFPKFQYQLHYNRYGGGAGASLISNKVDVSQFKGLTLGTFKFDE